MKVVEAKQMVLDLMARDIQEGSLAVLLEPKSPDPSDPGKFVVDGKVARAIHHFDGWYVPINLAWFHDGFDQPKINRQPFY